MGLRQSFHGFDLAMQQGIAVVSRFLSSLFSDCITDQTSALYREAGGTTAIVVLIKDSCIFCVSITVY